MGRPATNLKPLIEQLSDVRCEKPVTGQLVAWAHLSLLGTAAYGLIWLVAWAFAQGLWLGLVHLLVVAPLGLVAAATVIRLTLEVGLAVLQIREHVVEIGELPRRIGSWSGLTRLVSLGDRNRVSITRVETTRAR